MKNSIYDLQNGSDIRGVAIAQDGETPALSRERATAIGAAFAHWLGFKVGKNAFDLQICVGRDPRLSGEALVDALMSGMAYLGVRCSDAGLASTPAMYMSTVMPYYEFDGAVMVTASHLPYDRNGFKFFTREGGLEQAEVREVLEYAASAHLFPFAYDKESVNLMEMYAAQLRSLISTGVGGDLQGLKVAVDAGNGSGGFFATEVLAPLGADISGSQFLEPDGHFPGHSPNPEDAEAMASLSARVRSSGADLGILFDTDVDRIAAVASDGRIISRNAMIALAAAIGAEDYPGGTVVTDSVTSRELQQFLENDLGLRHFRYRRGYRNVINKAKELSAAGEQAFLAIETSGHAAYANNAYLDDGAFLAVQIIINAALLKRKGQGIEAMIAGLGSPAAAEELRLPVHGDDPSAVTAAVLAAAEAWAGDTPGLSLETPNYEGVRVNFALGAAQGWFLLRRSLHEPILPLNIEASSAEGLNAALALLEDFLAAWPAVEKPSNL